MRDLQAGRVKITGEQVLLDEWSEMKRREEKRRGTRMISRRRDV